MYGVMNSSDSDMALLDSIRNFLLADDCYESPDKAQSFYNPSSSLSGSLFMTENWSDLLQAANFEPSSSSSSTSDSGSPNPKRRINETSTVTIGGQFVIHWQ
ncbi:hypothetical protein Pint_00106 [Pistacia integerrima]|uniref:Uncharacterized protein n=1 Tax=Pistacia integerrima TaxID=434235 RepID=A0ACC0ZNZ6_9ROSI|nr:hypothetical protein Pint_00106 [Pistacia integerrima]